MSGKKPATKGHVYLFLSIFITGGLVTTFGADENHRGIVGDESNTEVVSYPQYSPVGYWAFDETLVRL